MSKVSANLQDGFLNFVRRQNQTVTIVLTNGAQFEGRVTGFDNFTVVITSGAHRHLVYKHAIAQMISDDEPESHSDDDSDRSGHRPHASKPSEKASASAARKGGKAENFNPIDITGIDLTHSENGA